MADETEGGCVSGTRAVRLLAVQQAVEHPSLLAGLVSGPTAEERMGAVAEEENFHFVHFLNSFVMRTC